MRVKDVREVSRRSQYIIISEWFDDVDADGNPDGYSEEVFDGMNFQMPDDLNDLKVYKILPSFDEELVTIISLYVKEV